MRAAASPQPSITLHVPPLRMVTVGVESLDPPSQLRTSAKPASTPADDSVLTSEKATLFALKKVRA